MSLHITTAGDFTRALFGEPPFPGPQGKILVWRKRHNDTGRISTWVSSPEEVDRLVAEKREHHDIYIGGGLPPAGKDLNEGVRFDKDEAAGTVGFWADLDWVSAKKTTRKKPQNLATETEIRAFVKELDPQPTFIVLSGNGLQAWWVLATPWLFKDDAERQEAQDLAERWLDELRRRLGKDLDGVANFDRILRLPFSRNQNTQRGVRVGPVLDTALEKQDGPRLSGDEWIGLSKDWPVEAKTTQDTTSGKKSRPDGSGPQSGPSFTLQADATPDSDWLEGLREKDALRDVLDERKGFESPSECDMSLASHLAGIFGTTDQQIADTLVYHRRVKHNGDLKLRVDYYERTIRKAREKQPITEEHIESASLSELAGLGIQRILELRDAPNPSRYRIVTKERDLELPGIASLTTNRKFRDAVAEILKKWPKGLKGDVWDAMVQRMLEAVEVIEPGHQDHPRSQFDKEETQEWLAYYLDAYKPVDEEDANVNSAPFTKNGAIYIFAHHFAEWLVTARSEKFTGRALYSRLKDAGWETHKVRLAQKSSVNAWRLVPASDGTRAHTHAGDHAHARSGTSEHAI